MFSSSPHCTTLLLMLEELERASAEKTLRFIDLCSYRVLWVEVGRIQGDLCWTKLSLIVLAQPQSWAEPQKCNQELILSEARTIRRKKSYIIKVLSTSWAHYDCIACERETMILNQGASEMLASNAQPDTFINLISFRYRRRVFLSESLAIHSE
jgi:hypothetical protein